MEVSKTEVEKLLGFTISEKEFNESQERAKRKLDSIIVRFGECDGKRRQPEYLIELIFEDVITNIFSETTVVIAANMLDMEKSTRQTAGAPFVTDHIVAQRCE